MTKQEFLACLEKGLAGLPQSDSEERIEFYSEMIDDRIEEGLPEENAIAAIGNVDEIIAEIVAEYPFVKLVKEKLKPKRSLAAWEIILLVLGSPIWLALVVSAVAVVLALYVSFWSVIISFWAVFASLAGSALGGVLSAGAFAFGGDTLVGAVMLAFGLLVAGLAIFSFYGCRYITQGCIRLTKKMVIGIKIMFMHKEKVS